MDNEPSWLKEEDGNENPFTDTSVAAATATPVAPVLPDRKSNDPSWIAEGSSSKSTSNLEADVSAAARDQAAAIAAPIVANYAKDAANAEVDKVKLSFKEMPRPWLAMKFFNFALTFPLIFIAWDKAFGDGASSDVEDIGKNSAVYILALYILIFGIMMCSFETCGTNKTCGSSVATYFGFMYTITGRVIFFILVGMLCLSLNTIGSTIVATLIFANALYNLFIMVKYAQWRDQEYEQQNSFLNDIEQR
mmetsp:Transcript_14891/g.19916  ORF Transcript_14891/g.19916 Transcript_14891/m.19916 type:complete len:249 (-) Transcript_14891:367-1113(-)|eukprot:CAMPEP_0185777910 /NCGR_PEP_ID=MMETSP1174-20130828/91172_1 /TAXON_ID=35687 /ORGANISM="Dictyocha speculum, Strain CCMP1381" /LENGTH=248 /DNA_ID=CAMNT_0028466479 /DNA_START=73 /DNA_END=819 /DNA_ORIENTATION=-